MPDEVPTVLPVPESRLSVGLVGGVIVALAAVFAAVGVAIHHNSRSQPGGPAPNASYAGVRVPVPSKPAAPAEPPEVPCHFDIGDVRVLIAGASLDHAVYRNILGRPETTEEKNLNVLVGVWNNNPARKIDFVGWSTERGGVKLTDDCGNGYSHVTFGLAQRIVGATDSATLYSDNMAPDFIVFERPVPAAKWLTLELPASNFGGTGVMKCRIKAMDLPDQEGLNKRMKAYRDRIRRDRGQQP